MHDDTFITTGVITKRIANRQKNEYKKCTAKNMIPLTEKNISSVLPNATNLLTNRIFIGIFSSELEILFPVWTNLLHKILRIESIKSIKCVALF